MNQASADVRVRVDLGARGYDIVIGHALLARAGPLIAPVLAEKRVIVVSDANVASLHLPALEAALDAAGIAHQALILPAGEQTKSFAEFERLLGQLLDIGVERGSTLVALGGGVVGDITGFAAAVLMRGIEFVQIPTTLLAQVDSSVGGKTGINAAQGKNLIGAFHQPRLVIADTSVLASLPPRDLRAGYAEVVKYGALGDVDFFAWLEANGAAALAGEPAALAHAIEESCRAKARIVAEDERESGRRALLNLGHTFGHALEAETGYGASLLHGEGVAIGMVLAADLSVRLGLCPAADRDRLERHLSGVGLPTGIDGRGFKPERLIEHMHLDKKVKDGRVAFVLLRGLGAAFVATDIDLADAEAVLSRAAAA